RADGSGGSVRERVGLPPIDRIAHLRVVGRTSGLQVEVPEVDTGRNAADAGDVMVAVLVRPAARLSVTPRYGSLRADTRAEGDSALDVGRGAAAGPGGDYRSPAVL